jgi:hypothetical protein
MKRELRGASRAEIAPQCVELATPAAQVASHVARGRVDFPLSLFTISSIYLISTHTSAVYIARLL